MSSQVSDQSNRAFRHYILIWKRLSLECIRDAQGAFHDLLPDYAISMDKVRSRRPILAVVSQIHEMMLFTCHTHIFRAKSPIFLLLQAPFDS